MYIKYNVAIVIFHLNKIKRIWNRTEGKVKQVKQKDKALMRNLKSKESGDSL